MPISYETPWGKSQSHSTRAEGIVFYSTAGHGGFGLTESRALEFRRALPEFVCFGGYSRWFEEDCDACAIVIVFHEFFQPDEIHNAIRAVRHMATSYPKWQEVVRFIESQPHLLTIERNEAARTESLWERRGLFGGMFIDEFARHWAVDFKRGSERKTFLVSGYPDKQWFTDEELAGLTEYQPELHDKRRRFAGSDQTAVLRFPMN